MARRKRTKRSNAPGATGLGILPAALIAAAPYAIPAIATVAAAAIPFAAGLFSKAPELPAFHFDPEKYSQDYAMALASQTQQAVAQQQVQAEQIKADSNRKLLIYGAIGVAGLVGVAILINALRKKG